MQLKIMVATLLILFSAGAANAQDNPTPDLPTAPPPPTTPQAPSLPDKPESTIETPETSISNEISLADWNRDDWTLLKPQLSLLEIDGYFRFRGNAFRNLDFSNDSRWDHNHFYPTNSDGNADFTGTNMRLRFEPRINITNKIRFIATIDVFDNLVLGSTPNSFSSHSNSPVDIQSTSQNATDAIAVKRAYATVTALNEQLELRFGRMPDHWGTGILRNSGDCIDCDYGDVVDRMSITFRLADHLFSPMYTWRSSGPTFAPLGTSRAQALDAYTWDDVDDYSMRIMKVDHEEDIREQVLQGETVFNYGLLNSLRQQSQGLKRAFYYDSNDNPSSTSDRQADLVNEENLAESRDGFIYTGDAFLKLYTGNIELAIEAAIIYGNFSDTATSAQPDPGDESAQLVPQETTVYQLGGALDLTYNFDGEYQGTALSLQIGGASGDSAPGFGALSAADSQRNAPTKNFDGDTSLDNFQFNPDYHVDLILFRQMIGTVTDAWYVKPTLAYQFDTQLTGKLSSIYSQAIFKRSTPSCFDTTSTTGYTCDGNEKKGSLPLGIEFDAELSYNTEKSPTGGSFGGSFAGGILFPLSGFDNLNKEADEQAGSFAWALQAKLHLTF